MMKLRTFALTTAVLCSAVSQAVAQESGSSTASEAVEEIVVTGSRLPRRDFNAVSPIATIDDETLSLSGQATLEESLNQMPQVAPDFGRVSNNPGGGGSATVNLRGLGADRTLVLLNGRRIAPSGAGSAVDVNSLPQALIERVEIITGGATTVYGADAVAGVVNFIIRDDFEGIALDTSVYTTEAGDSNMFDINLTWGRNFADGRGNVTLYGGYYDREETFAYQREFTSQTLVDNWDGTVSPGGSSTVPEGIVQAPRHDFGDGVPERITFDSDGNPLPFDFSTDFYNYAPGNYLQIPLERSLVGAMFKYEFSDRAEFYAEGSYAINDAVQNLAPIPANGFFSINTDNPALTPEMQQIAADEWFPLGPGIVGAALGRRMVELGSRTITANKEYARVVLGLRGDLGETWKYDAWYTWSDGQEEEFLLNDASSSRLQQGLLVDPVTGQCFDPSGGCEPVNLFGAGNLSEAAIAFIRTDPYMNETTRNQQVLSAYIRGAPFSWWAGPVNLAFGAEYRTDEGDFTADPALSLDDQLGYRASASIVGKESVAELYAEAAIPLAEGAAWAEYLGLELGARISEYDNAGRVETWKVGGEWQLPVPVRFRTMFQRSVRAPNLQEAFTEQGVEQGTFVGGSSDNDPCSAANDPIGSGLADACVASGLPASEVGTWTATFGYPTDFVFGGNPAVKPESADTFTAGFVFDLDVLRGMQLSVDYFSLEVEDTIGELDVSVACYDVANSANLFCDNIDRNVANYNVERVYEPYINRGLFTVSGVDTQLSLETDIDLSVNMVWTHTFENSTQETEFGTVIDCVGTFGWPCIFSRWTATYPENRVNVTLDWYKGDFSTRLAWRWIEGTENGLIQHGETFGLSGLDYGITEVSDKSYLDLSFGYRFNDNIAGRFVIANITETSPPLMADYIFGNNNTDAKVYDLFGRAYTLSFSLQY
jgi:outer membrane receptor protein involved in Fe transport